mmetsp:Transcript_4188/g.16817  ORF Transcript_4188/g.16817 Transcript_4188/m.16817 type:complete len:203 (-) Transcript_4188:60-668(-)
MRAYRQAVARRLGTRAGRNDQLPRCLRGHRLEPLAVLAEEAERAVEPRVLAHLDWRHDESPHPLPPAHGLHHARVHSHAAVAERPLGDELERLQPDEARRLRAERAEEVVLLVDVLAHAEQPRALKGVALRGMDEQVAHARPVADLGFVRRRERLELLEDRLDGRLAGDDLTRRGGVDVLRVPANSAAALVVATERARLRGR